MPQQDYSMQERQYEPKFYTDIINSGGPLGIHHGLHCVQVNIICGQITSFPWQTIS